MRRIFLLLLLILGSGVQLSAQQLIRIRGTVKDENGQAIRSAVIRSGAQVLTRSDQHGSFVLQLAAGSTALSISRDGYLPGEQLIRLPGDTLISFTLRRKPRELKVISIRHKDETTGIREQAYAVAVAPLAAARNRNTDINRLLDALPGIRVRESGGMGASFNYTINGLSGKAVRFFVDGVPIDNWGAGFSINNFPANALDRIEVYKGVTPISLGGDALGGAVNLVTRKELRNYLDLSYSYGSFGTHKALLSGRWQQRKGFTTVLTAAYQHSDNNYEVWGTTVEVADSFGRPLPEKKYRRFNDDYTAISLKTEIGISGKRWADALMLGLALSDMQKGIQTGRTMAFVYGDVRYREQFLMPSLRYAGKDILIKGLALQVFAGYHQLKGQTIDTGSVKYNWAGDPIAMVSGELNGIRAARSRYTFLDHNFNTIVRSSYAISGSQALSVNYALTHTTRKGSDPLALAEWTIPFRSPQRLVRHISGLSYQLALPDKRWTQVIFVKNFSYAAEGNSYDYNGSMQKELVKQYNRRSSWGMGYGTTWQWHAQGLLKLSAEQATRMPDAAELLGDGNTILNAPNLKPERSINVNAGLQQSIINGRHKTDIELGAFYRNTSNLIWLGEGDLYGTARYENINKINSKGLEVSLRYSNGKWLEASANATWQDLRNRQRYTASGAYNITYNDKMKNMPALLANAELRFKLPAGKKDQLSFYAGTHYVQGFYLNWPSLGAAATKKRIPAQLVQDAGLTYSLQDNRYHISLECRNILDKQVYDNYLLQKPGRAFSILFRCFLSNSNS